MREGRLNRLAELVEKKVYKRVLWVSKNILREEFSHNDMMHNIKVSLFQAWAECPERSDEELLELATKECKKWYTGSKTACYDRARRESPSISREKIFNSDFSKTIENDPLQNIDINTIYEILADTCGHEIAILYILSEGYSFPTTRIVEEILGTERNSNDFNAQRKRVERLKNLVSRVLKEKLNVSRESRKLLNL
jgi:hypothetical protein